MEKVSERKGEQSRLFRERLPALLHDHAGEYVLFADGKPVDFYQHRDLAFKAALELFDVDDAWVIHPIAKPNSLLEAKMRRTEVRRGMGGSSV